MGVRISNGSYKMDSKRLDALDTLLLYPEYKTLKWLQHVIGTCNSMRNFAGTRYAAVADPLFALLKCSLESQRSAATPTKGSCTRVANNFIHSNWSDVHDAALRTLVQTLKSDTQLVLLRRDRPVFLSMDSSDAGTGGACGQYGDDGKFYYAFTVARRFSPLQRLWSVGGRELYGWLLFMRRYWRNLIGHEVVYRGDHLNLLKLEDLENTHVQRWLAELNCFEPWASQFRADGWTARLHVPGVCIALCDYLSRYADPHSWVAQSDVPEPDTTVHVRRITLEATNPSTDDSPLVASRPTNAHTSLLSPWMQSVADVQAQLSVADRGALIEQHKAVERTTNLGTLLFVGGVSLSLQTRSWLIQYSRWHTIVMGILISTRRSNLFAMLKCTFQTLRNYLVPGTVRARANWRGHPTQRRRRALI